jgi:hypothetical protein
MFIYLFVDWCEGGLNIRCYVDGANPGFIRQLKISLDDNPNSDYKDDNGSTNEVISVSFGAYHKQLLQNLYMLMNKGILAIPPENDKLITSLFTTKSSEYSLDKEATAYDDVLDGLRLSLKMFHIK